MSQCRIFHRPMCGVKISVFWTLPSHEGDTCDVFFALMRTSKQKEIASAKEWRLTEWDLVLQKYCTC